MYHEPTTYMQSKSIVIYPSKWTKKQITHWTNQFLLFLFCSQVCIIRQLIVCYRENARPENVGLQQNINNALAENVYDRLCVWPTDFSLFSFGHCLIGFLLLRLSVGSGSWNQLRARWTNSKPCRTPNWNVWSEPQKNANFFFLFTSRHFHFCLAEFLTDGHVFFLCFGFDSDSIVSFVNSLGLFYVRKREKKPRNDKSSNWDLTLSDIETIKQSKHFLWHAFPLAT